MALSAHQPSAAVGIVPRLAAYLLDVVVLSAAVAAFHGGIFLARGGPLFEPRGALEWELFLIATVSLPCWCYFAFSEASARQATLGKRVLNLRVVDVYGSRIGLGRSWLRTLVKLAPWECVHIALCFPEPVFAGHPFGFRPWLFVAYALLGLYLAAAMLTLKKQSVHDLAAGTYVIEALAVR
jgi:uncharacterized RDD family membrane protein YckC